MKPKCAWIDHCGGLNALFAMELRQRGIQLDARSTLDEFLASFDLNDYPVLFYHPGRKEVHRIKEVMEKYPNLTVALITAPGSDGDYRPYLGSDIPVYTYDVDYAEKFILEHQSCKFSRSEKFSERSEEN